REQETYHQKRRRDILKQPVERGMDLVEARENEWKQQGKGADAELEDLLPVQKQFLGMGPRNVRAVQASLLDIARELGIDASSLPVPEVVR
ncbi:MAG: hypothetical protein QGG89_13815, partial [Vicinamibacterales bacterium]|nr:hypothetical protein [Vicinamibacterales bacterium]